MRATRKAILAAEIGSVAWIRRNMWKRNEQ